jgi:HD-GYP domain-containing protein (c-di-GMP phosphodiesterase class II)
MRTPLRLADLLAGLSVASDLGFGLRPETAMRSCLVATRLARALQLPETEVADTYYASLLFHVGCPAFSHETATLFGNELAITRAVARTNLADPADFLATLVPEATRGLPPAEREALAERLLEHGEEFGRSYDTAACEVASVVARRIGLGAGVARALYEVGEWWDGTGVPQGLRGDEISLPARIARLAADAVVLEGTWDEEHAVRGMQARAGSLLDPTVVEAFAANATELLGRPSEDPRIEVLEEEPQPVAERDERELQDIAAAFADVADLKLPAVHGHSRAVAALATVAAGHLGLDAGTIDELEIAALLHDIGRLAVSNAIWEKPGPLTAAEWEQVRMHPYHSERILAGSRALEPVARIAGMHHEKLDGSGYHRGAPAREQSPSARVLAVADAFQAMTQDRPHRAALSVEQAAQELRADARAGKLDADCVAAVLQTAGHAPRGRQSSLRPAGLTEREIEVLRLVAVGHSNPEIARILVISPRTAEHHVQHIYAKLDVSSRPAVALFALEHDLL